MAESYVATAFIVADDAVRIKVESPTVSRAVACLIAAYYVWDARYPSGYENTMTYIENEVVSPAKMKPAIEKFIRDRDHKLRVE